MTPEFRAGESYTSAEERKYDRWLSQVWKALPEVSESDAHDLYIDGCTVAEAIEELLNDTKET
jgi:hypothetical protein